MSLFDDATLYYAVKLVEAIVKGFIFWARVQLPTKHAKS